MGEASSFLYKKHVLVPLGAATFSGSQFGARRAEILESGSELVLAHDSAISVLNVFREDQVLLTQPLLETANAFDSFRPHFLPSSEKDLLAVLFSPCRLAIFRADPTSQQLVELCTRTVLDVAPSRDPGPLPWFITAGSESICIVSPKGKMAICPVLPSADTLVQIGEPILHDVSHEPLSVIRCPTPTSPFQDSFAVLSKRSDATTQLTTVSCDLSTRQLETSALENTSTVLSSPPLFIAPCPSAFPGQLLAFQEGRISVVSMVPHADPVVTCCAKVQVDDGHGGVKDVLPTTHAWDPETSDTPPKLWVFAEPSHLFCLTMTSPSSLSCTYIGNVHRCSSMVSFGDGALFLSGKGCDSSVIQVDNADSSSSMEGEDPTRTICTLPNISPVVDCCPLDDGQGQDHLLMACGQEPHGSLRVLRNGAGTKALSDPTPGFEGVNGVWNVPCDSQSSLLAFSFVASTRVFSVSLLGDSELSDVTEDCGFEDAATLTISQLAPGVLLQATEDRICLIRISRSESGGELKGSQVCLWRPSSVRDADVHQPAPRVRVCAVSHRIQKSQKDRDDNHRHVILAGLNKGTEIFVLRADFNVSTKCYGLAQVGTIDLPCELSCADFVQSCGQVMAILGTHAPSLQIVRLPSQLFADEQSGGKLECNEIVATLDLGTLGEGVEGTAPESIRILFQDKLENANEQPLVLAGLRDGNLLSANLIQQSASSRSVGGSPSPLFSFANISVKRVGLQPVRISVTTTTTAATTTTPPGDTKMEVTAADGDQNQESRGGHCPPFLSIVTAVSDRAWIVETKSPYSVKCMPVTLPSARVTHACPMFLPPSGPCLSVVTESGDMQVLSLDLSKRVNVQSYPMPLNPRHVAVYKDTLVLVASSHKQPLLHSTLTAFDLSSERAVASFEIEGEEVMSLNVWRAQEEGRQAAVVCVGTSLAGALNFGHIRFLSLQESTLEFTLLCPPLKLPGPVCAICPYNHKYLMVAAGKVIHAMSLDQEAVGQQEGESTSGERVQSTLHANVERETIETIGEESSDMVVAATVHCRIATRHQVRSLSCRALVCATDLYDGIILFRFDEEKLELAEIAGEDRWRHGATAFFSDDSDTIVSVDWTGLFACHKYSPGDSARGGKVNLTPTARFDLRDCANTLQKGCLAFKFQSTSRSAFITATLKGAVVLFAPLSSDEHKLLFALQTKLKAFVAQAKTKIWPVSFSRLLVPEPDPYRRALCTIDGDALCTFLQLDQASQELVWGPEDLSELSAARDVLQTVEDSLL